MATINDLGTEVNPDIEDFTHVWDVEEGVDVKVTLETIKTLVLGGELNALDTNTKSGIIQALNEIVTRLANLESRISSLEN